MEYMKYISCFQLNVIKDLNVCFKTERGESDTLFL